jgi:hypothetical protein
LAGAVQQPGGQHSDAQHLPADLALRGAAAGSQRQSVGSQQAEAEVLAALRGMGLFVRRTWDGVVMGGLLHIC